MFIDVHNHVIPVPVLRLAERASGLGMSAAGGQFRSSRHVPFPLVPAFHDPPRSSPTWPTAGCGGR